MKTYQRTRQGGTVETVTDCELCRMAAIRTVVAEKQYAKIDGCMADLFTASIVCQVYDALSETNKAKFAAFTWPKMAQIALKLTS